MNENRNMPKLIPAILETEVDEIVSKVHLLRQHPDLFYRAQLDVVDGVFTKGKTVEDPNLIPNLLVDTEAHLMVSHPDVIIRSWMRHPSIKRITVQVEAAGNIREVIERVKSKGKEISLACNPETPFQIFEPYVDQIDGVLFLGVTPGKQGQPMQTDVIEKIKEMKKRFPGVPIAIDGGVNLETVSRVIQAGADEIIIGSAIWKADDPVSALRQFSQIMQGSADGSSSPTP